MVRVVVAEASRVKQEVSTLAVHLPLPPSWSSASSPSHRCSSFRDETSTPSCRRLPLDLASHANLFDAPRSLFLESAPLELEKARDRAQCMLVACRKAFPTEKVKESRECRSCFLTSEKFAIDTNYRNKRETLNSFHRYICSANACFLSLRVCLMNRIQSRSTAISLASNSFYSKLEKMEVESLQMQEEYLR